MITYQFTMESKTGWNNVVRFNKDTPWIDIVASTYRWVDKRWCYHWEWEHFMEFCRRHLMAAQYGYMPVVRVAE